MSAVDPCFAQTALPAIQRAVLYTDISQFTRDFPDTTFYWPKMVALSVVEDEYGLEREIAWWSPGVVGRLGDWTAVALR